MVDVVQQVHVPAQRFAGCLEEFRNDAKISGRVPDIFGRQVGVGGFVEIFVLRHAIGRCHARHATLQADRPVALRLIFQRGVDGILYGRAIGMAIDHHAFPAGPAQKLIDRKTRNLALDVPQRHVDRRDGGHGDGAAPPIGALVEILPDILDPVRVPPDQAGKDMVGQIACHRQFAAVERRVAHAIYAFVGDDLEGDEIAAGAGDDDLGIDDLGH